jgi:capsular polysaccharide transport system permease protein
MLQILTRREKGRGLVAPFRVLLPASLQQKFDAAPHRPRIGLFRLSFLFCVVAPALLAAFYLSLFASDQYVSEAHFTIRKAGENRSAISDALSNVTASMGMASLALGTSSSNQDIFIVADYIRSRTIIDDVGGEQFLKDIYARDDVDWLSRLSRSASLEKVWKYWKTMATADIDTPSGVITLDVRAFSPGDAHRLAELILTRSETLVNEMSERMRQDALKRAQGEVKLAEDRLKKARADLLSFRNKTNLIDPMLSAQSISDTIAKLTQERVTLENNRATLGVAGANSPTVRVLNAQIAAVDQQITDLKKQLTNKDQDSAISGRLADYENLQLEVKFAEKLYSIAVDGYDAARRELDKQQLYLVRVDQPNLPDRASYPRILIGTLTVFAGCMILWSMITLLVASVRDHMGD